MTISEFWLALSFLTRIPVPKHQDFKGMALAQAAWAFPLAGLVVGWLAGSAYILTLWIGISHIVAAWITVGCAVLLTGGLHEDGLADTADALAHGRDREQKLAIMKDSRIGSYGVIALVIILAIRASAITSFTNVAQGIWAMAAAGMASRASMVILMYRLPFARTDGLAAEAGKPTYMQAKIAFLMGIAPLLLMKFSVMLICVIATVALCLIVSRIAMKHFGGITGDVLGATQQLTEACLLALLAH